MAGCWRRQVVARTEAKSGRAKARRIPWALLAIVAYFAVASVIGTWGSHQDLWVPFSILLLFLGFIPGLFFHEFGHLWCGRLLSIQMYLLSVGVGPLLFRGRIGDTRLEVRALPLSGFVAVYPELVVRKYRVALFLLSGVLGNIALIALLAAIEVSGIVPWPAVQAIGPLVFAQLYFIVVNLLPLRARIDGRHVATDGLQLLQLLRGPSRGLTQYGLAYAGLLGRYGAPVRPATTAASARVMYQISRLDRWDDADARRDRRESLLRELASGALSREEVMLVLDGLITDGLLSDDPAVRPHLDEWSLRATKLGPDIATLVGSRGAVLVELGRYDEGKALLAPIVEAERTEPLDALLSLIFLARAEHACGDDAAARRYAASARQIVETIKDSPIAKAALALLESSAAKSGPAYAHGYAVPGFR
jgi:hypothetical protein